MAHVVTADDGQVFHFDDDTDPDEMQAALDAHYSEPASPDALARAGMDLVSQYYGKPPPQIPPQASSSNSSVPVLDFNAFTPPEGESPEQASARRFQADTLARQQGILPPLETGDNLPSLIANAVIPKDFAGRISQAEARLGESETGDQLTESQLESLRNNPDVFAQSLAGIARSGVKGAASILTPEGAALTAGAALPIVGPLVRLYLGFQGAKGVSEGATELGKQWDSSTPEQRAELLGNIGLSASMAALPFKEVKGSLEFAKEKWQNRNKPGTIPAKAAEAPLEVDLPETKIEEPKPEPQPEAPAAPAASKFIEEIGTPANTKEAFSAGRKAKTIEDVKALAERVNEYNQKSAEILARIKAGERDLLESPEAFGPESWQHKAHMATEALEAATGFEPSKNANISSLAGGEPPVPMTKAQVNELLVNKKPFQPGEIQEPSTPGETNASGQQKSATVGSDVPAQPGEGKQAVPVEEGSGGIRSNLPPEATGAPVQPEKTAQPQVPLAPAKSKIAQFLEKQAAEAKVRTEQRGKEVRFGMLGSQELGNVVDAAVQTAAKLNRGREAIQHIWKTGKERNFMDQTRDAVDNEANILGDQAGRGLRIKTTPIQREAAMAVVEAKGDVNKLGDFLQQVTGKNKKAEAAVRYAMAHWEKLQDLAKRTQELMDSQIQDENQAGIDTQYTEGYVPHLYDKDLWQGASRPYVIGGGGTGLGTGFKKGRSFETIFDAIEAGYKPKTMDVADLVDHRIRAGQKLINIREWGNSLKSVADPVDGRAIGVTPARVQRPNGTSYETVPPGYVSMEVAPGVRMGIHESYLSLFKALTGDSRISGSAPGKIALETKGALKHGLLAFDTFHLSRILQKKAVLTGKPTYSKGASLLEYRDADLDRAVQAGDITPEIAQYVRQNRPQMNLLVKNGLNVGRVQEALYTSFVKSLPILGQFNKFVFEKVTRGAMMEAALHELDRVQAQNPRLSADEVARTVSRDINAYFGNLGRQGLFKSRTFQDMAQLIYLAPQWREAMMRSEVKGAGQIAKAAVQGKVGTLGKGLAQGLLAYFVGTQILNLVTRGKPTWENEEKDHKFDAFIPDAVDPRGNGFWMSPFAIQTEMTHDFMRYLKEEGNPIDAAKRLHGNLLSPPVKAAGVLATGEDPMHNKLNGTWERAKAALLALNPTPIPLQSRPQPGSTQRQLTASAGFKTEPAKTATARIQDMAAQFQKAHGKEVDRTAGPYTALRRHIRNDDNESAAKEIEKLRESHTDKQIVQAMKEFRKHPFTGSKTLERQFLDGLPAEDQKLYEKARDEMQEQYDKFSQIWEGTPERK